VEAKYAEVAAEERRAAQPNGRPPENGVMKKAGFIGLLGLFVSTGAVVGAGGCSYRVAPADASGHGIDASDGGNAGQGGDASQEGGHREDAKGPDAACVSSTQGRNCASPLDNDCDGRPDDSLDQRCSCVPGSVRECDVHPGKDGVGVCRAGTQTCVLGAPPSTSSYGPCSGSVGPTTDDCNADGLDNDCDGIKGNGPGCTRNVYVYALGGDVCELLESDWPDELFMVDADDTAGVPGAGFRLLGQFKIFRDGVGAKLAVYRCSHPSGSQPGFGACMGDDLIRERLLGYTSVIDGGNGWVQLMDVGGRNGILCKLREDDPKCCPYNCLPTRQFVLK
jgi:hypothetical protein